MKIRAAGTVTGLQQAGLGRFGAFGPNWRDYFFTSYITNTFFFSQAFLLKNNDKKFCKNFRSLNQHAVEIYILGRSFYFLSSDCWLKFFEPDPRLSQYFFWKRPQKQFSCFARIQVGSVCGYGMKILGWINFFGTRKNLSDIICPKTLCMKRIQNLASFSIARIFPQHTLSLNLWEYITGKWYIMSKIP